MLHTIYNGNIAITLCPGNSQYHVFYTRCNGYTAMTWSSGISGIYFTPVIMIIRSRLRILELGGGVFILVLIVMRPQLCILILFRLECLLRKGEVDIRAIEVLYSAAYPYTRHRL